MPEFLQHILRDAFYAFCFREGILIDCCNGSKFGAFALRASFSCRPSFWRFVVLVACNLNRTGISRVEAYPETVSAYIHLTAQAIFCAKTCFTLKGSDGFCVQNEKSRPVAARIPMPPDWSRPALAQYEGNAPSSTLMVEHRQISLHRQNVMRKWQKCLTGNLSGELFGIQYSSTSK